MTGTTFVPHGIALVLQKLEAVRDEINYGVNIDYEALQKKEKTLVGMLDRYEKNREARA